MIATLLRCATEMLRGLDCVHRIPSRSRYSQNSAWMSAERFEKERSRIRVPRDAPARQQRAEPVDRPAAVGMQQAADELARDRPTIGRCHGVSSILRSCSRPGPCCGNASGQRALSATTRTQLLVPSGWARTRRGRPVAATVARQASTSAGYAASHVNTSRCVRTHVRRTIGRNGGSGVYNRPCSATPGDWCNGNIVVSKTIARGSIPRSPAETARTERPPIIDAPARRIDHHRPGENARRVRFGLPLASRPCRHQGSPPPASAARGQRRGGSTSTSFPRFSSCAIAQAFSICAYVYRTGLCRVSMWTPGICMLS
jgi:hypothetical protein